MKGLFSYDGVLVQTINRIIDSICLSFLWLIFSIPIITVGAASTALYYTVNKVFRNGRGQMWQAFWGSFKSNFKQSTIIWVFLLIFYILFAVNGYYGYAFYANGVMPVGLLIVIIVVVAIVMAWSCYVFPYIARFTNSTKEVLFNCLFLLLRHFLWSVLLLGILVGSVALVLYIPLGLTFAPVVCTWTSNFVLERIFRKYMSPEDLAAEEERNKITAEEL